MNRVCVIGGANMDISARALSMITAHDSNLSHITLSCGGVGRNIARTMVRLGMKTEFVTVFSSDDFGRRLMQDCVESGIGISGSKVVDDMPASLYIAILDENGDMSVAMNDMRILECFDREMILAGLSGLEKDDILVVDGNLSEEHIRFALENAHCLKAADPVSAAKAGRLSGMLDLLDVFKPNRYEAELLSGIRIEDAQSAAKALDFFLDKGVGEILISLADEGVLLGSGEGKYWYRHRKITLANATGGGDSFLAGYLLKRSEGCTQDEAVRFAVSAAVCTIETAMDQRQALSRDAMEAQTDQMEIEVQRL